MAVLCVCRQDGGDEKYDGISFKRGTNISAPMNGKRLSTDTMALRSVSNLNLSTLQLDNSTILSNEAALHAEYGAKDTVTSRKSGDSRESIILDADNMDHVDFSKLDSSTGFMVNMPRFDPEDMSHVKANPYASATVEKQKSPARANEPTQFTPFKLKSTCITKDNAQKTSTMASHTDLQRYETMQPTTQDDFRSHTLPPRVVVNSVPREAPVRPAKPVVSNSSGVARDSDQSENVESLLAELNATLKLAHENRSASPYGGQEESPCHHREIHKRVSSDYFYDALGEDDYAYDKLHRDVKRGSGFPPPPLPPRNDTDPEKRSVQK